MEHSPHIPVVKTWSEGSSLTRLVLAEAGPSCRRTDAVAGLVEAVALAVCREIWQSVQG
jgi:hypothetical protein